MLAMTYGKHNGDNNPYNCNTPTVEDQIQCKTIYCTNSKRRNLMEIIYEQQQQHFNKKLLKHNVSTATEI